MNNIIPNTINIPRYPTEFQQFIMEKNHNFVGRQFVFSAINEFMNNYDRGYFTIIGEPGIGKSAIIAHYVDQNPGIVYYNVEIPGKNYVEEFLKSISSQLLEIAKYQGGKNIIDGFNDGNIDDSNILSLLLQKISDRLHPEQKLIITIDGCDRININHQIRGSNILYLPRYLPQNVYFILTRRPFLADKSGLLIEAPSQFLDLANYPEQNRADIQEYLQLYFINHQLSKISQDEINFMYVSEILTNSNLELYYQTHLDKMNLTTSAEQTIASEVLKILTQEKSISLETIAEILDEDEYDIKIILDKWREFLHLDNIGEQINYSLYHHHFSNWLQEKI